MTKILQESAFARHVSTIAIAQNRTRGSTHKFLRLATVLNLDHRLSSTVKDSEGEMLHVRLNLRVGELATNKSLRIEDSVPRVHRDLVLRSVTDETLILGGCDIGVCCAGVSCDQCDSRDDQYWSRDPF